MQPSPGSKYKVQDDIASIRFTFPPRRNWATAGFMLLWLAGWTVGEVMAAGILLGGAIGALFHWEPLLEGLSSEPCAIVFLAVWLTVWTFGGVAALKGLRQSIGGKEIVEVNDSALTIRKTFLGMGGAKRYEAAYVDNLHVEPVPLSSQGQSQLDGPLVFDYIGQKVSFGGAASAADAHEVLALISSRFPDVARNITEVQPATDKPALA